MMKNRQTRNHSHSKSHPKPRKKRNSNQMCRRIQDGRLLLTASHIDRLLLRSVHQDCGNLLRVLSTTSSSFFHFHLSSTWPAARTNMRSPRMPTIGTPLTHRSYILILWI